MLHPSFLNKAVERMITEMSRRENSAFETSINTIIHSIEKSDKRLWYGCLTSCSAARERRVGWRLDYFLVSEALVPLVQDVVIHEDVPGSDHCPVELMIG